MRPTSNILDILGDEPQRNRIVRVDYSPLASNQARLLSANGIDDQAVRRRYEEGVSIDGIESRDLDDAIWAERTSTGYAVFVHISDVTEAVRPYSPLDVEALKRTTSIYRGQGVVHMFPSELSQDLLSLDENGEKLTLSLRIDLDHDSQIRDFEVYESVFRNRRRFDYASFSDDFLNPDSEHHETLQLFYEIASRRRKIRRREGANMDFNESDRQLALEESEGCEEELHSSRKKIPSMIVEEFMIMGNIASAIIAAKHGYASIFRLHNAFDERAFYHNAPGRHAGLALERYTHFTSPIRRYADMVVHRVMKLVHLRGERHPYSLKEIGDIAGHINLLRTIIEVIGRDIDRELRGERIITRLRARHGTVLTTSHLTTNLRHMVSEGHKIPEIVVEEILKDLENGERANWSWAIGVLLVSKNERLRDQLRKSLLDDRKFSPKSALALLNDAQIARGVTGPFFQITETEYLDGKPLCPGTANEDGDRENSATSFSIVVEFEGKELLRNSIDYGKFSREASIGKTRRKVLERILTHFCGKLKKTTVDK